MYVLISVLIVLASFLVIFVVVIQNSKGGGLAAGFSSSNQVMGVRKTTDFLEKLTWGSAATVIVLCILSTVFIPRQNQGVRDSEIKENIQNAVTVDPNATPFGSPESATEGQQQPQPQQSQPQQQPQQEQPQQQQ